MTWQCRVIAPEATTRHTGVGSSVLWDHGDRSARALGHAQPAALAVVVVDGVALGKVDPQKIVRAACRIAAGSPERLHLGNLDIQRDWGWAPEYVDAMWRMLQQGEPRDFVIATGETRALRDFVAESFAAVHLDWRKHIDTDPNLMRPTDIAISLANPGHAAKTLGWHAKTHMQGVVIEMVSAEQARFTPTQARAL